MVWSLQVSPQLSDQQFEQWSKLLEERTGIQLAAQQRGYLQTQITMRMREMGLSDYSQYFDRIVQGVPGMVEWSMLVDRLVVKETNFFRHRPSIEYVRQILQNRINNRRLSGSFDVWSVGCATGEEPYSLAMVINDCFELASLDPYYGVMATDISQSALNFARQGIYRARKLEMVKPEEKARYFRAHQEDDNCKEGESKQYLVDEKLRDRVCFSVGNVLKIDEMPPVKMDVIYCQNLLIYFRRWRRRAILNAFVERLKPGGVLIIGLGEIVDWEHQWIRRIPDEKLQAYCRS